MNLSPLDINDHDDIKYAKGAFDNISNIEWQEYIDFVFGNKLSHEDQNFLTQMRDKAGQSKYFTSKMVRQTFYWEHLGRLGDKEYVCKWKTIKWPTYEEVGLTDYLITADELNGINPAKIEEVIRHVLNETISSTRSSNRYSKHHYSLR